MSVELAVIPVAGQGTGLLPLTKSQPKEMLPVGAKPAVQYVVEEMADAGVRQVLFVTGPGKQSIENHFDINAELIQLLRETGREELLAELDFERRRIEYFYTRQRRQLGLGHAIRCAQAMVGEAPFVIALGDTLIGPSGHSTIVRRLIEEYQSRSVDAVVALEEVSDELVEHSGIAQVTPESGDVLAIARLVEKPLRGEAPSKLALAARYVCGPSLFAYLEKTQAGTGGEIQLTDALDAMIQDGRKVLGVRLPPGQRRFDVGDFASYFEAFVAFALADPRHGQALGKRLAEIWPARGGV